MFKLKNLLFFILIGFGYNLCNAQLENFSRLSAYLYNIQSHKTKSKSNIPLGTIHLKDNKYIDAVPVNNVMYLEFLYSVLFAWNEEVSEEINKLPDYGLNMALMKYNFDSIPLNADFVKKMNLNPNLNINGVLNSNEILQHPKYSFYPIVNITKKQAEMHCKWRSDMLSIRFAYLSKDSIERKKYHKKLTYRLPTNKELLEAINKYGFSKKKKRKDKLFPFDPYLLKFKNRYKKAYFFKDNISELTLDSIPFGNNWKNAQEFEMPNDYTGFRCICEVSKN